MPGLTTSRNSRSTRRSPLALLARFVLVGAVAALLPACTDPGTGKKQAVPEPMAGYGAAPLGSVSYPVPPGARYVAPNGNDAAAGTEAAPWRTLAHAVSAAPGGSTIVMRGGTYRESVEVPATRSLTIQPAAGEEVWLSGSDPISGFVRDGGAWRKPGWTVEHTVTGLDPTLVNASHPLAGDPDMAFVDGRRLTQVANRSAVVPGTFFVDDLADTLWIGDDPAGRNIEGAVRQDALIIRSSDTTVRGIGIRHYATPIQRLGAVKAQGDRITFEDLVVTDNAGAGLSAAGDGVRFSRGTAAGNGQLGIQANQAHRLVVEGSLLRGNNVERFSAIAASGGVKVTESDGVVLRQNLAEGNLSHGLWLDLSSNNATIVRNVSRDNLRAGIIVEMSVNHVIASNASIDNEAGVIVSETSDVDLANNTLVGNLIAAHVVDGRRAPRPIDIRIRNNVMSSPEPSNRPLVIIDDVNRLRSGAVMRVSLDRNAYYRRSTAQTPYLMAWTNYPSGKFVMRTVNDVRTQISQDRASVVAENVATDPFVDDLTGGRYALPPTNALVRTGLPLRPEVAAALRIPADAVVPVGVLPAPG